MNKEEISILLDERDILLDNENYDEKLVDSIQKKITKEIKKNFNKYEVDFIIETWTRFGCAPCLVYDDNGKFAVSGDGYGPAVFGDDRIEGSLQVFVEKEMWKKTIREALKYFIFN